MPGAVNLRNRIGLIMWRTFGVFKIKCCKEMPYIENTRTPPLCKHCCGNITTDCRCFCCNYCSCICDSCVELVDKKCHNCCPTYVL
jgi:hypothetical protein